ncbi:hypothetical protein IFM89_010094 [Coptis chinensis]|uniref:Uncharacterized protein n=1 Tax=Coptis chinensis TaxID=261450 RepID=A0A835I0W8_9MAGN|nr:hypothetical protein IFM89_010094 [Coptis chinensis]
MVDPLHLCYLKLASIQAMKSRVPFRVVMRLGVKEFHLVYGVMNWSIGFAFTKLSLGKEYTRYCV